MTATAQEHSPATSSDRSAHPVFVQSNDPNGNSVLAYRRAANTPLWLAATSQRRRKGIIQAYEIQRRLKVWPPRKAAVLGSGTIGLLAALILRLRGVDVTAFARTPEPYLNSELLEAIGRPGSTWSSCSATR